MSQNIDIFEADIIDETLLSLEDICRATQTQPDFVITLIEHNVIEPIGSRQSWQFDSVCLKRTRIAVSFARDLDINLPGIALALDLLEQLNH